jgi:hypothetical protein
MKDSAQKKALVERAMKVIEQAIEKDQNHSAVHKW